MDRYKFGNNICRLREKKGLTQEQFAKELDVTDKAVSKWENGQSVPRMETLEAVAEILETTVDALLLAGKDNRIVICIENDYADILHLEIDGKPYSIGADESQWVDVNPDGFKMKLIGMFPTEEIVDDLQKESKDAKGLRDKLMLKAAGKLMKEAPNLMLFVNCIYSCNGLKDGDVLTVKSDCLDLGDKTLVFRNFILVYPLIKANRGRFVLENCYASNKEAFIKRYKREGLWMDLGDGFLWMIVDYPIRGAYFRHMCKPKSLKKYILNADKYRVKEEKQKEEKKRHKGIGCLSVFFIFVFLVVFGGCMDFVFGFVFIDSAKPALVAEDYSQITYYDGLLKGESVYARIDELPENAYYDTEPLFGASVWYDARTDGLSRFDQMLQDDMVCLYKDNDGNKYLWLVEDYGSVEFDDYDDFDEHYVFMHKNKEN